MARRRGRRIEIAWTVLVLAVAVLGLVTSDGEPVCDGPFILQVDDSSPPGCPSPVKLLPTLAIVWAVGLLVIVGTRALARSLELSRR
jgi:hypothetical protein